VHAAEAQLADADADAAAPSSALPSGLHGSFRAILDHVLDKSPTPAPADLGPAAQWRLDGVQPEENHAAAPVVGLAEGRLLPAPVNLGVNIDAPWASHSAQMASRAASAISSKRAAVGNTAAFQPELFFARITVLRPTASLERSRQHSVARFSKPILLPALPMVQEGPQQGQGMGKAPKPVFPLPQGGRTGKQAKGSAAKQAKSKASSSLPRADNTSSSRKRAAADTVRLDKGKRSRFSASTSGTSARSDRQQQQTAIRAETRQFQLSTLTARLSSPHGFLHRDFAVTHGAAIKASAQLHCATMSFIAIEACTLLQKTAAARGALLEIMRPDSKRDGGTFDIAVAHALEALQPPVAARARRGGRKSAAEMFGAAHLAGLVGFPRSMLLAEEKDGLTQYITSRWRAMLKTTAQLRIRQAAAAGLPRAMPLLDAELSKAPQGSQQLLARLVTFGGINPAAERAIAAHLAALEGGEAAESAGSEASTVDLALKDVNVRRADSIVKALTGMLSNGGNALSPGLTAEVAAFAAAASALSRQLEPDNNGRTPASFFGLGASDEDIFGLHERLHLLLPKPYKLVPLVKHYSAMAGPEHHALLRNALRTAERAAALKLHLESSDGPADLAKRVFGSALAWLDSESAHEAFAALSSYMALSQGGQPWDKILGPCWRRRTQRLPLAVRFDGAGRVDVAFAKLGVLAGRPAPPTPGSAPAAALSVAGYLKTHAPAIWQKVNDIHSAASLERLHHVSMRHALPRKADAGVYVPFAALPEIPEATWASAADASLIRNSNVQPESSVQLSLNSDVQLVGIDPGIWNAVAATSEVRVDINPHASSSRYPLLTGGSGSLHTLRQNLVIKQGTLRRATRRGTARLASLQQAEAAPGHHSRLLRSEEEAEIRLHTFFDQRRTIDRAAASLLQLHGRAEQTVLIIGAGLAAQGGQRKRRHNTARTSKAYVEVLRRAARNPGVHARSFNEYLSSQLNSVLPATASTARRDAHGHALRPMAQHAQRAGKEIGRLKVAAGGGLLPDALVHGDCSSALIMLQAYEHLLRFGTHPHLPPSETPETSTA
jgi:hypothetical protein